MKRKIGRWTIENVTRPKDSGWGRFGGGWNHNLGIQVGERTRKGAQTVIINLWTRQYRATRAAVRA